MSWLSQKKDKPGKCEAPAEQDGPIPQIETKKSAIRCTRNGHELPYERG
jgi:hypothetical protein